jgi:hypothetical protein
MERLTTALSAYMGDSYEFSLRIIEGRAVLKGMRVKTNTDRLRAPKDHERSHVLGFIAGWEASGGRVV